MNTNRRCVDTQSEVQWANLGDVIDMNRIGRVDGTYRGHLETYLAQCKRAGSHQPNNKLIVQYPGRVVNDLRPCVRRGNCCQPNRSLFADYFLRDEP